LKLPRSDFLSKTISAGVKADLFCYWEQKDLPIVAGDIVDILDSHGIDVDIDWYYNEEDEKELEAEESKISNNISNT
jgi:hypothetical protein